MHNAIKYQGKVVNIIRKMLKLSYARVSGRLGISTSHFNAIITGGRSIERSKNSTRARYDALFNEALALTNGEHIFTGLCLSEGVPVGGVGPNGL